MITRDQLESYRQQLMALGVQLCRDRQALKDEALQGVGGETSGSFSNVPTHPGDLGTHYFEEELTLGLLGTEEGLIEEINAALERIEQGTFGRCEACAQEIPGPRLNTLPHARYCIDCARKIQKAQPTLPP
jgi:RNA polymerase-binding transcription factor DksA